MADLPARVGSATPLHVWASAYGYQRESSIIQNAAVAVSAATTWTAKLVSYMPVVLPFDYMVQRVWWMNGTTNTTSNVDFGIYSPSGAKIYSTGTTAMGTVAVVQYVTPATPFMLSAGAYYFAWSCDNTTARAQTQAGTANAGRLVGMLQETTGSFGLPATMTPIAWANAFGYSICGVTRTTTGF